MALVDYFLKIDGMQGESTDSKHKNEIELESFSWGASQPAAAAQLSGRGAGKVSMEDFHVVKRVDKASPKLMLACASGEHVKSAVLTCRKAGKEQQEYLKITLSDVLVSSYRASGSAGSDVVPMEEVSLNFSKVEFEYKEQKPDGTLGGTIKAGWNLREMKPV